MMTTACTCAQFEALLPDYLEPAGLDARQRAPLDAHRAACATCDALARDLADIVTDAARLPLLTPSRDLWGGIAERIGPRIVALPSRAADAAADPVPPRAAEVHRRGVPRTIRVEWFAAAAAALIAVTAGVTWQLARTPAAPGVAAAPATITATPTAAGEAGDAVLAREIDALRDIVDRRYGELDSATVTVIRGNLAIIDAAIADSRAALARDPKSRFLADQLEHALARKVELLREVALLERGT